MGARAALKSREPEVTTSQIHTQIVLQRFFDRAIKRQSCIDCAIEQSMRPHVLFSDLTIQKRSLMASAARSSSSYEEPVHVSRSHFWSGRRCELATAPHTIECRNNKHK
eukprot:scaffold165015_cov26-Prasinocladus_malaysianus.AAC.2